MDSETCSRFPPGAATRSPSRTIRQWTSALRGHDGKYLLFSSDRSGAPICGAFRSMKRQEKFSGPPEPLTTNSTWVADVTVSGDGHRVGFASVTTTSNIQRFDFDPLAGSITSAGQWVTTGSAFRRYWTSRLTVGGSCSARASCRKTCS